MIRAQDVKKAKLITIPWKDGDLKNPLANRNIALIGTSGSRKTKGFLIPLIYALIALGSSLALIDPKGELYREIYPIAKYFGYNILVFNTLQPSKSDGFPLLKFIRDSETPREAADFAATIILENANNSEDFYGDANRMCLTVALLYVARSKSFKPMGIHRMSGEGESGYDASDYGTGLPYYKHRTIEEVYNLLSAAGDGKNPNSMGSIISNAIALDPEDAALLGNRFSVWWGHEKKQNIQSSLGIAIQQVETPSVGKMLSEEDIDFKKAVQEKTIIFVECKTPSPYKMILNLFVSFMFNDIMEYVESTRENTLKRPFYFVGEEMRTIGRIPNLPQYATMIRSYNIGMLLSFQNIGQVMDLYGTEEFPRDWETLLSACALQLCVGSNDETTQQYFSILSGCQTVLNTDVAINVPRYALLQFALTQRNMVRSVKSEVMTPDDIKKIKAWEILICPATCDVLLAKKYMFYNHPFYGIIFRDPITKRRILKMPSEHIPRWQGSTVDEDAPFELYKETPKETLARVEADRKARLYDDDSIEEMKERTYERFLVS